MGPAGTPTGPPGAQEPDATAERIVAAAEEQARRAEMFGRRLEDLRVTGRAGGASVTLDHLAGLRDLDLDAALARGGPARARHELLSAAGLARRDVVERVGVLADEAFGAGSETALHLRAQMERQIAPSVPPAPTDPQRWGTRLGKKVGS